MMNAASTSNPSFIVNVGEAYPHPSHVIAPNFVTMKLSGKDTYNVWETQILCLLKSHQMYGFIDGQFPRPAGNWEGKAGDLEAWIISDSLVKGWILGSLSKEAVNKAVNHLKHEQNNTDFTAKDLWDELRRSYGPSAASTSNPSIIVDVGEVYPYPSVIDPNFVTVKLSGKNKYNLWEKQMVCLLKSHQMYGFIDGQFPCPAGNGEGKAGDLEAWIISDSLVKGWIFGSLSEEAAGKAVNHLTHMQKKTDFTAKDLWDELQRTYDPLFRERAQETKLPTRQARSEIQEISVSEDAKSKDESLDLMENSRKEMDKPWLYDLIIEGYTDPVIVLAASGLNPWDKLTNNGNTVLHVAVGSSTKNHHILLHILLEKTPKEKLLDIINSDGSTVLHIAAIGGNTEVVNMLVGRNPELLLAKDKDGHIPLALSVSNMHTKTSKCLFKHMKVHRNLLEQKEKEYDALLRGEVIRTCKSQLEQKYDALLDGEDIKTSMCLLEQKEKEYDALFTGKSGEDLVILAISCQDFGLANMIINDYRDAILSDKGIDTHTTFFDSCTTFYALQFVQYNTVMHIKWCMYQKTWCEYHLPSDNDAVLTALAQNFPRELNFCERIVFRTDIYIRTRSDNDAVLTALTQNFSRDLNFWERRDVGTHINRRMRRIRRAYEYNNACWTVLSSMLSLFLAYFLNGFHAIVTAFLLFLKAIVHPFIRDTPQVYKDAETLLRTVCFMIKYHKDSSSTYHQYYNNSVFEATRRNSSTFIRLLMSRFPDAIWSIDEDGHNFIQYSVINCSEKIYNLLYEMSEHKNIYKTIKDSSGNNLLHLAARLAPTIKLNLITGASLQIQRELQWFKEVERFVCPLNRIQMNLDDETPQMVFTREHKNLVIEGEKWIKKTVESYTITTALIITIVFAAAITVPGGNNQESGIPIFTNNNAFKIFAISDAMSLFTAATSLLIFLSILTTERCAEQDFLLKLPTKLIIGLTMLFLSTTSMIIAFGATLFLVFAQSNSSMLIPIGVLTCLPITSFVNLQFPLIVELIRATYCGSFFVREKYDYFY